MIVLSDEMKQVVDVDVSRLQDVLVERIDEMEVSDLATICEAISYYEEGRFNRFL
jgi:hypothetical protein